MKISSAALFALALLLSLLSIFNAIADNRVAAIGGAISASITLFFALL